MPPHNYQTAPGRVPPHSCEAEEQLLSACLLDGGEVLDRCTADRIRPASFYVPANRVIFEVMLAMHAAKKPIDLAVLFEELKESKRLDEVGGLAYLSRVSGRIPTTAGASYFIEKVRELATRREVIRACTYGVENAYDLATDTEEYVGKVEAAIMAATQDRIAGDSSHAGKTAKASMAVLRECAKNPGKLLGIRTGYKDVDSIVGGLRAAEYVVIAGRPSCGKTSYALNIGENVAFDYRLNEGKGVWVASLEMSEMQLGFRLIAQRARANITMASKGLYKPNSQQMRDMEKATEEIASVPLWIDDNPMTISMLRAKARRIHAKNPLALIVVDYIQLIIPEDSRMPREQQVAESSRGLKALAKELDVPVIVLAQLNRDSVKTGRSPQLSDLRESGSIEQDADVVMMLHPEQDDGSSSQVAAPTMKCYINKNRNGSVGDCRLSFLPAITRFENFTQ